MVVESATPKCHKHRQTGNQAWIDCCTKHLEEIVKCFENWCFRRCNVVYNANLCFVLLCIQIEKLFQSLSSTYGTDNWSLTRLPNWWNLVSLLWAVRNIHEQETIANALKQLCTKQHSSNSSNIVRNVRLRSVSSRTKVKLFATSLFEYRMYMLLNPFHIQNSPKCCPFWRNLWTTKKKQPESKCYEIKKRSTRKPYRFTKNTNLVW